LTDLRARANKDRMIWSCPKCNRAFRRANLPHACTKPISAQASKLLKNRPPEIVALYRKLEATVKGFGKVEVVIGDHYVLFRTTRIFTDLTVMKGALRVVIHLGRKVPGKFWLKVGPSGKRVSHVALVRTAKDLRTIMPFLREAYRFAVSEER
jgi:hypothetical protein